MSAETLLDDSLSIDNLIQEIAGPIRSKNAPASIDYGTKAVTSVSNRRRAARVNVVSTDVLVLINGEHVKVADFSIRGLQVRSTGRLVPGTTMTVSIRWRDEPKVTMALARVLWSTFEKPNKLANPYYRVGATFESADVRVLRTILARCGLGKSAPDIQIVHSRW